MTETGAPTVAPAEPPTTARRPSRPATGGRLARLPWWTIVVPFAAVYVLVALGRPVPSYFPDEMLYQHLARSLAAGDGFAWRDEAVELRSALYVYLLAPVWVLTSGARAYQVAKVETALLSCLVAVPVWYLARTMLSRGLALGAVALSLTGTWMAGSASLLTESVALPLATASLAATVQALRRGSVRLLWLAVLLALLAAWARAQVVVLIPVLPMAIALDAARAGRGWRERLRIFRGPLLAVGTVVVVGAGALLARGASVLGTYGGLLDHRATVSDVLDSTGQHLLGLAATVGFLPLLLLAVLAVRRRAWRDPDVGPLLAVLVPAVLVLAVQNGLYLASIHIGWAVIERYMIYVAPLLMLFALVAVARPGLVGSRTLAASALLGVVLLATPDVVARVDQRAEFATAERWHDVLPQLSTGPAMALTALLVCAAAVVAVRAVGRSGRLAPGAVAAVLLVLLALQSVTALSWQRDASRALRTILPADMAWVDHHSHGPVAVLNVDGNSEAFGFVDFFNERISRYYALKPRDEIYGRLIQGGVCRWAVGPDGGVRFPRACPPGTDEFLLNDPLVRLTFAGERAGARDPRLGRLVRLGAAPRLRSMVTMPCLQGVLNRDEITRLLLPPDVPVACQAKVVARLWLDEPGELRFTIRGAPAAPHVAALGGVRYPVPPGQTTTIAVPLDRGEQEAHLDLDWAQRSPLDPEVVRVDLVQRGTSTLLS